VVRDAFRAQGHDAWSCDLLPSEGDQRWHLRGNVLGLLAGQVEWDLLIAHPPCTYLAVSGARWFKDRRQEQDDALAFVQALMDAPVPRIAIENPIGVISTRIRRPDQVVQPWMFGHGEVKATCLWLKNLPRLRPTNYVARYDPKVHMAADSAGRSQARSRTLPGLAAAMAGQWV
jgi:site-specific DNA-cytosine methylase